MDDTVRKLVMPEDDLVERGMTPEQREEHQRARKQWMQAEPPKGEPS